MNNGKKWPPQAQHRPGQQPTQPWRPGVLQPKAAAPQARKAPAAPPAYQPQVAPRCLQLKAATPRQPSPKLTQAPAPAPHAFRPQATPKVLQRASAIRHPSPAAQQPRAPKAPPVYQPQPTPRVLQTKQSTAAQAAGPNAGRVMPAAPPAFNPSKTQTALQRRVAPGRPPASTPPNAARVGVNPSAPKGARAIARPRGNSGTPPTLPGRAGVVQRMITVANPNSGDYATLKVLHQLTQFDQGGIRSLTMGTDFSGMQANEILYIVGHGSRDDGEIKGMATSGLIKILTDKNKGVPNNIGGIVVLTCYSGIEYDNTTLVNRIADGLKKAKKKNIPVRGAKGFAYGSPVTRNTGFNSVLPRNRTAIYSGTAEEIVQELSNYVPSEDTKWKTPQTGLYLKLVAGTKLSVKPGLKALKQWAAEFVAERDRIENAMKDKVSDLPNQINNLVQSDVTSAVNALAQDNEFEGLVDEQYNLFNNVGLFIDPDEAYTVAIS